MVPSLPRADKAITRRATDQNKTLLGQ